MEDSKYLYETKPKQVRAVQWNGENGMEVNKFASYFGKHDVVWGNGKLLIRYNCYEEYELKVGDYLVHSGGIGLRTKSAGEFESRYRKVVECKG